MEILYQYLLFLAQAITVVVAIVLVLSAIASMNVKRHFGETGHLEIKKLNDRMLDLKDGIRQAVLEASEFKKLHKQDTKAEKATRKQAQKKLKKEASTQAHASKPRMFVLDFKGDLQASKVKYLRTEITAILTMARAEDTVVVRLESPGGAVHGYGLAASQLDRIKQHNIPLIAIVDKVAASGGYLMAAVADRILAAPFAVIGSIGVVAQVPNVHRLLKKHDVDVEVLTAGKYKRTLTVLGENTEEGRKKFVEELEEVHALFQDYVSTRRPALDMDEVSTGEAWYGQRALEKKLVDEITTSDEFLTTACEENDVFEVHWIEHKKPIEKLLGQVESSISRLLARVVSGLNG